MVLNFEVHIRIGPRTETSVECWHRSQKKTVKLKNGKKISNTIIAKWIEDNLTHSLKITGGEIKEEDNT